MAGSFPTTACSISISAQGNDAWGKVVTTADTRRAAGDVETQDPYSRTTTGTWPPTGGRRSPRWPPTPLLISEIRAATFQEGGSTRTTCSPGPRSGPKYSIDSRAKAQVVAERNVWKIPADAKVTRRLSGDGTGSLAGTGNIVNGKATDVVAAYNAANSTKLKTTVNWPPPSRPASRTAVTGLLTDLTGTTGAGVLA